MTPKLLLIADDQGDNRVVFSSILRHHRYDVFLAINGQEAVEQARRHAPDLILMDLEMPVMSGWDATRVLKADPATASIPVVAVTARDETPERLQQGGFCAYVRKPVRPRDLVRAVELCLAGMAESRPWIELPAFGSRAPEV